MRAIRARSPGCPWAHSSIRSALIRLSHVSAPGALAERVSQRSTRPARFVFQPGTGVHRSLGGLSTDTIKGQVQDFGQVFVGFFPTNVVQNFSANDIIPIILIAVTISVAYLSVAEKEPEKVRPFREGVEALKLVIYKVVGYVIRVTPYAIVALTADMVGSSTNLGKEFTSLVGLQPIIDVHIRVMSARIVFDGILDELKARNSHRIE